MHHSSFEASFHYQGPLLRCGAFFDFAHAACLSRGIVFERARLANPAAWIWCLFGFLVLAHLASLPGELIFKCASLAHPHSNSLSYGGNVDRRMSGFVRIGDNQLGIAVALA